MTEEFLSKTEHLFDLNDLKEYATAEICDKLQRMVARLQEFNAHTNLTAIRDEDGILVKHIADSLKIVPFLPKNVKLLDVGCGGGFPSLPIAIARPDISVVALDSTEKKVNYVKETATMLGLSNLQTFYGRAEELAHLSELRESFDIVTARAVAALPMLSELCIPFVKVGGQFIAMKSLSTDTEIRDSAVAVKKLGTSPFEIHEFILVSHENTISPESRTILVARKHTHTPELYPRAFAKIKKSPIR